MNIKKIYYVVFKGVLILGIVTLGCVQMVAASGQVTLKVWLPPQDTTTPWDKFIAETNRRFEAANPGVKIQYETTPWEGFEDKYIISIASGEFPDVGYSYSMFAPTLASKGALEPLDNFVKASSEMKKILFWSSCKFQGKIYGVPYLIGSAYGLLYNKDLLDKAGVPYPTEHLTWDDFASVCLKLNKPPNQWAMAYNISYGHWGYLNRIFFPWLFQAGGDIVSKDGTKVIFNSPEAVKALEFVHALLYKYKVVNYKTTQDRELFGKGKTAFYVGGDWEIYGYRAEHPNLNMGFICALTGPAGWPPKIYGGADFLIMSANSKYKDLAWKYIEYSVSTEELRHFANNGYKGIWVNRDMLSSLKGDPVMEYELTTVDRWYSGAFCIGMETVNEALWRGVQLALMNKMGSKKALDQQAALAQVELNKLIK